ncbi:uncharacterized protein PAC_09912 [Phialocephala subalpina]|uniref:Uncharacterized protein n=1 Tax=Phialocephala subalpina TaxID=576137 RepID=A0A1L7X4U0_9HELO|nr:uncharacterized protein PAC_09912 [Phialocephala subalpina]
MNRKGFAGNGNRVPERSKVTAASVPKPPAFSFVTITNPNESKTRSKKRAVRSHVAYYQHHKDDERYDIPPTHRRSTSKRIAKIEGASRTSTPTPTLSSESSSESINFQILLSDGLAGTEFDALGKGFGATPISPPFSGTRIDPFRSYPVRWKPFYDPILDFYLTYILVDTPSIDREGEVFLLRTTWFPFIMKSPTTFYAALAFAGSIYHFRKKLSLGHPSLLNLRQKAISGINESLSSSKAGPDDTTIGAVFCMSILESMYGDSDSYKVHITGLQRMVDMRGGLKSLGLEGLLERMILWLDFNHAKVHGTPWVFKESVEASRRASPFKHPKDPAVDLGRTRILR